MKDRITCRDVLRPDATIHPLRHDHGFDAHFLEAFPFVQELRRLGVTQVEIWTRLARAVLKNQAKLRDGPWH
jgi:hypothetical protein